MDLFDIVAARQGASSSEGASGVSREEFQEKVGGITISYEGGLNDPASGETNKGVFSDYTVWFQFSFHHCEYEKDDSTGELKLTWLRNNLPPANYFIKEDGKFAIEYDCEFSDETFIFNTEDEEFVFSKAELDENVKEMGATSSSLIRTCIDTLNIFTAVYTYIVVFPDKESKGAAFNELFSIMPDIFTGFKETYRKNPTPTEVTSTAINSEVTE